MSNSISPTCILTDGTAPSVQKLLDLPLSDYDFDQDDIQWIVSSLQRGTPAVFFIIDPSEHRDLTAALTEWWIENNASLPLSGTCLYFGSDRCDVYWLFKIDTDVSNRTLLRMFAKRNSKCCHLVRDLLGYLHAAPAETVTALNLMSGDILCSKTIDDLHSHSPKDFVVNYMANLYLPDDKSN